MTRAMACIVAVVAACGANAPAVQKAEVSCLDTYGPEIAQAFATATAAGDAVGVVLSVEAAWCAATALGAKVVKAPPRDAPTGG